MKTSSLMSLALLVLLLASLSPAQEWPIIQCVGKDTYAANSTYEAHLRRLAAELPAEVSASRDYRAYRVVGDRPNRLQAFSYCRLRYGGVTTGFASTCAACIAGAFPELERACPYHRRAAFFSGNCALHVGEFKISFSKETNQPNGTLFSVVSYV